ncbi:MAG: hypothetical protein EB078_08505 [Proteobacteria bacterium]|nr:hypothetical protein [Pseudomonadota bacterium]NDC25082.1 hypothetical protein [Pseudomonadota bacterium]NDD04933.1 hypothetical protein [Pseudomonadota bacterium]NDG27324.1 hypothetical protein [Pseudomonadota bacterium]
MGRRKKTTEAELENTQTTLSIEDSNRVESEEAELIAETEAEESLEIDNEHETETKKTSSKRTKKEISEIDEVTAAVDAAEASQEAPSEHQEEVSPKRKPRKPRAKKTDAETAAPPIVISTESVNNIAPVIPTALPSPQLDDTLKQWNAIKQLSESVALLLDKTSHLKSSNDCEINTELLRPQTPSQNLFISKFATAASIVAILLSLVSLSLSQSARHAVLGVMDPIQRSQFTNHSNSALTYSESKRINRTNQSESANFENLREAPTSSSKKLMGTKRK